VCKERLLPKIVGCSNIKGILHERGPRKSSHCTSFLHAVMERRNKKSLQHLFARSDGMCKVDEKCHMHVLSLVGFNPQPVAAGESVQVSAEVSGRAVDDHMRPWGNRVCSSQVECFQGDCVK